MIPLDAFGKPTAGLRDRVLGRITATAVQPAERSDHVLKVSAANLGQDLQGYAALLGSSEAALPLSSSNPGVTLVATDHLNEGDVVVLGPTGHVRTLYRRHSRSNFLFATDRCNSYCLMCSQPPKQIDDRWRVRELLRLIELVDPDIHELCITGGEPTLLKDDLVVLLERCRDRLPLTAIHVLSNGRLFVYDSFARRVGQVEHPDLMFGVPLYSDLNWQHDHVVQARGAYDQTIAGLNNLNRAGVLVEIRVVLHRWTIDRLVALSEFIYRNLTFASQVVFMGLETTGLAIPNLPELWIDPWDYRDQLEEAVWFLASRGVNVSIYNHQLCTVSKSVWPFCRQSISDWKNDYLPACEPCRERSQCGGFFTSSVTRRFSDHIRPIRPLG